MKSLSKKRKSTLRIAIIAVTVLALIVAVFLMFTSTNGYAKEQARFAKVLSEASDEELFIVLNYAIAQHYVPNKNIDPFYNKHVMVGCWQRSLMVYNNLSNRKDLLKKIYPDLKVLDEYVKWGRHGAPTAQELYARYVVSRMVADDKRNRSAKMFSRRNPFWKSFFPVCRTSAFAFI
jgi:hypothetical protein